MFGLQAAEEEIGQYLTDKEGSLPEQAAQVLRQLLNDCVSTWASCAPESIAARRLVSAILEPLSRLVSPLLATLKDKPSDAQVIDPAFEESSSAESTAICLSWQSGRLCHL